MVAALPDELLKEVLAPQLRVSDEMFSSVQFPSPFSKWEMSSSSVLLVNKRWMRVATPLLYEVIILRSSAQAQALAAALTANRDFGRFIRKLRIEGGYGSALGKILPHAPNITDFFLTLQLYSDDQVTGLVRYMSKMNPRRVILHDRPQSIMVNSSVRKVVAELCACLREHWKNIVSCILAALSPYSTSFRRSSRFRTLNGRGMTRIVPSSWRPCSRKSKP